MDWIWTGNNRNTIRCGTNHVFPLTLDPAGESVYCITQKEEGKKMNNSPVLQCTTVGGTS